MRNCRLFVMMGVIILGLALVSGSLAAVSQARLGVSSPQLSTLTDTALPANPAEQARPANLSPQARSPGYSQAFQSQPAQPAYQPYVQHPPSRDWQALEDSFLSAEPEAVLSDFGEWDSSGVYAPTILRADDTFFMWYTGIAWDNTIGMGLATSTNGIDWDKSIANPLFLDAAEGSIIQLAPDDLRLYYANWNDNNIYVALSSDNGATWTPQVLPVFTPTGVDGDWDRDVVADPMVLYIGGTYYMFYEGGGGDPLYVAIGLATSPDGISWTRVGGDPVLINGDPGDWDEMWVLDPMVREDGGEWEMWFRGVDSNNQRAIGYATSDDGETWTKHGSNPVFTADLSGWDTGGPSGAWVEVYDELYHMWYYSNRQIGYATSEDGINWDRPLDDAVLKPGALLYLELNYGHDWAHVYTLPNELVTVTLKDAGDNVKGIITGYANDWGDFWSSDWSWDTGWQDIQPFDKFFVEAAGLATEVNPIGEIQGLLDVDTDTLAGSLNAPWLGDEVPMSCELWSDPWGGYIDLGLVDSNGGSFECDYTALGVDLQPGMQVAVIYTEPDGDRVINVFEPPWMRVNYGHDWLGGNYPPGHTFNLTIKDAVGNIKATAIVTSESGKGWGGDGFETRWEDWTPIGLDIVPGDWAIFQADDGFEDIVHVGDIQGAADVALDQISGPVFADWYTEDLFIECHPWGAPYPVNGRNSTAGPDGDPPYTCDWSGEWDILPGQDVAVMYAQPENADRVINVFHEPAPNMAINKWVEGSGLVVPGGPVIFNIAFGNTGEATSGSITITDTLPADTTYLMDTSGASVITGTGWVAWDFGPLAPGEWKHFYLVLENTAQVDDILGNNVEVFTEFDFDDGNDYAYAEAQVIEGNTNLYVDKFPAPGDPTPGEVFMYQINYGNQDAVASGPVTLTETLPAGTSLVDWYSQNGFGLWTQTSYDNGVLVLNAPSLPGYWGDSMRVVLSLDSQVEYGTQLTNTVEINTPGDIDPNNNWYQNTDAWVSPPRLNAYIHKSMPWERIYPGGTLVYPVNFSNDGNTTFDAVITDTLPEGMSFVDVHAWWHGVEIPFDPVYVDDEVVVWEYPDLLPADWINFDLRLAIDPDYVPGTPAINCIEIDGGEGDSAPYNNISCVEYLIPEAGPNLRLTKYYWWNGEGQLQYNLDIQNIGSTGLDNVWITDTLPEFTASNGNWWVQYGPWITATVNTGDTELAFWVDYMNPGDNASVAYQADLDGEVVGELGLTFTNLAVAPINGDVYPADNTASVTAFTGADIFIDKWLGGGELMPGEIITFTVEFGNLNQWPWDGDSSVGSHITDTLPAGVTFLYATAPWNVNDVWEPESVENGIISWGWGPMWSNNTWRFDIVVQLADSLKDGDILTNRIEAYGDNPEDFDFFWDNNFDEVIFEIDFPFDYYLPMNYKH